ncbi:MAG: BlaI/MecI/CopY family transcriptional regulator [Fermentimonas sp.]|nr:BlaI/MecI/CopY family transcriptional regulator [Fermentimonas sp.]MDD4697823.1 BlaI/MecI/CopY family transcriptional regulator [Fermentimonas sp.]
MRQLTDKEEEIMQYFWDCGPMFIREVLDKYPDPKPHYNTISTVVRLLEEKGFIDHKVYGNTYQYFALISREQYKGRALKGVVSDYFDNSYTNVVTSLIEEENISVDELKKLIEKIEKGKE